jgi:hypothetical protein
VARLNTHRNGVRHNNQYSLDIDHRFLLIL